MLSDIRGGDIKHHFGIVEAVGMVHDDDHDSSILVCFPFPDGSETYWIGWWELDYMGDKIPDIIKSYSEKKRREMEGYTEWTVLTHKTRVKEGPHYVVQTSTGKRILATFKGNSFHDQHGYKIYHRIKKFIKLPE